MVQRVLDFICSDDIFDALLLGGVPAAVPSESLQPVASPECVTEEAIELGPYRTSVCNILTIDLEEYFQPTEVTRSINPTSGHYCLPGSGSSSVHLGSAGKESGQSDIFRPRWVAERQPGLVAYCRPGHEIGCHSYAHRLFIICRRLSFARTRCAQQRPLPTRAV